MRFFLVRHGETEWNKLGRFQGHEDISLNERGMAQAKETAQAALEWGHCAIYSSPLVRTVQVAEEITKVTPMTVSKEPGLKELSLGDLEGVTGEQMREEWPIVFAQWRANPEKMSMPNGESLVQLQPYGLELSSQRMGKIASKDSKSLCTILIETLYPISSILPLI